MPSIRSLLAGFALTTFTLLNTASAAAIPCTSTTPTLPVNGGPTELPAATLKLAYVVIGRGVQNYTCTGPGAAPTAIGAIANLYDATKLASTNIKALHAIPAKAVYAPKPKAKASLQQLPYLGHHYFDAAGTPVFTLTDSKTNPKPIVFVAKALGIKAPATADIGPAKTAAVDWLLLNEKTVDPYTGKSVGLKQVYRVVTAGGGGGTCDVAGVKSVEYATEYWFYN